MFFCCICHKNVKDIVTVSASEQMPVVIHPAYFAVLPDNPVINPVKSLLILTDLFCDAFFHHIQVVRMNHPLEGIPGKFLQFFKALTAPDGTGCIVGIYQPFLAVCLIGKKSSGQQRCQYISPQVLKGRIYAR